MPPRRHATLRDVADEAGVSVRTVSNVVNDFHYVSDATRTRVEDAIARLGYRPNRSARSLRSGSTSALGLVLPALSQPYYAELADAVFESARARGYKVLIEPLGPAAAASLRDVVGDLSVATDGILLSPVVFHSAELQADDVTTPIVVLASRTGDSPFDHVTMDDVEGARIATAHLLETGRRRVATIGAAHGFARAGHTGTARLEGYERAHADASATADPALAIGAEDWTETAGYDATRQLLDSGARFDAVFAMNDLLAVGVLHALQDNGRKVPDDVAVVGFDDIAMARHLSPPLTTVDPGMREIVDTSMALLARRIGGDHTAQGSDTLIRPTLRVRGSAPFQS